MALFKIFKGNESQLEVNAKTKTKTEGYAYITKDEANTLGTDSYFSGGFYVDYDNNTRLKINQHADRATNADQASKSNKLDLVRINEDLANQADTYFDSQTMTAMYLGGGVPVSNYEYSGLNFFYSNTLPGLQIVGGGGKTNAIDENMYFRVMNKGEGMSTYTTYGPWRHLIHGTLNDEIVLKDNKGSITKSYAYSTGMVNANASNYLLSILDSSVARTENNEYRYGILNGDSLYSFFYEKIWNPKPDNYDSLENDNVKLRSWLKLARLRLYGDTTLCAYKDSSSKRSILATVNELGEIGLGGNYTDGFRISLHGNIGLDANTGMVEKKYASNTCSPMVYIRDTSTNNTVGTNISRNFQIAQFEDDIAIKYNRYWNAPVEITDNFTDRNLIKSDLRIVGNRTDFLDNTDKRILTINSNGRVAINGETDNDYILTVRGPILGVGGAKPKTGEVDENGIPTNQSPARLVLSNELTQECIHADLYTQFVPAGTKGYAGLKLGNSRKPTAKNNSTGTISFYDDNGEEHQILPDAASKKGILYLPALASDDESYTGHLAAGALAGVGSETEPVYLSSTGELLPVPLVGNLKVWQQFENDAVTKKPADYADSSINGIYIKEATHGTTADFYAGLNIKPLSDTTKSWQLVAGIGEDEDLYFRTSTTRVGDIAANWSNFQNSGNVWKKIVYADKAGKIDLLKNTGSIKKYYSTVSSANKKPIFETETILDGIVAAPNTTYSQNQTSKIFNLSNDSFALDHNQTWNVKNETATDIPITIDNISDESLQLKIRKSYYNNQNIAMWINKNGLIGIGAEPRPNSLMTVHNSLYIVSGWNSYNSGSDGIPKDANGDNLQPAKFKLANRMYSDGATNVASVDHFAVETQYTPAGTEGFTTVTVGSSKAISVKNNSTAKFILYSGNGKKHTIIPSQASADRHLTIPNHTGWLVTGGSRTSSNGEVTMAGIGSATLPTYLDNTGVLRTIDSYEGTADKANQLVTPKAITTNLGTSGFEGTKFDGTNDIEIGIVGTLPVENGGTGTTSIAGLKTAIGEASTSDNGLMSKTDKAKLDGLTEYSVFSTSANGLVPKPDSASTSKFLNANGQWSTIAPSDISVVTTYQNGLFSAQDYDRFNKMKTIFIGNANPGSDYDLWVDTSGVPSGVSGETQVVNLGLFQGTNGTSTGREGIVPGPTPSDYGKFLSAGGGWENIPNPKGTTSEASKFLRGDGTWADVPHPALNFLPLAGGNMTGDIKYNSVSAIKQSGNNIQINALNSSSGKVQLGAATTSAIEFGPSFGSWSSSELLIKQTTTIANNTPAALRFQTVQTDNSQTTTGEILVYDDGDANNAGTNMVINPKGALILGGGKSAKSFYLNNVHGQTETNSVLGSATTIKETQKQTIITSDQAIYFVTNCIANQKSSYIDTSGNYHASKVYGAVWNDYAEYREVREEAIKPGCCVIENGDDTLSLASARMQPGANIVSDTFGFAIGETDMAKTPLAVSGRVLAYPYEDRNSYNPGDAVCSAPGGKVSKMTREEIINYPERIIGTVSAIPTYDTWGTDNIPVDGRIWIKVR